MERCAGDMRSEREVFGSLVQCTRLTLLCGAALLALQVPLPGKQPLKKDPGTTEFHRLVLISTGGSFHLPFDRQTCIDPLAVILDDEGFFQGLRRVRGPSASQWRYLRDGQTVDMFPNALSIEIRAVPSYCPQRRTIPPWPPWNDKLVEFMGALRFKIQWLEGSKFTPADIDSVRTSTFSANGWAWPRWSYYLETWAVRVPITDDLSVEVLSPDGQSLVRVIGGMDRADPINQ